MGRVQRIVSSRGRADVNSYIGNTGRLFYGESETPGVAPDLRYSDGVTPGGLPISGAGGGSGTVSSIEIDGGTTGLTASGGPITTSGIITLNGTVNVSAGGTGANNSTTARINLDAARRGNNSDITSLSGLTTSLSIAQGGTGVSSISGYVRGNSTDPLSGVSTIPFADITGIVPINQGGTGQTSFTAGILVSDGVSLSTTNLISGADIDGNITGNAVNVTGIVGINHGGTGAVTPSTARAALEVARSGANGDITSLSGLTTALSITQGGTGSTSASDAITALLPSQTGNANKYLKTDGTTTSWASLSSVTPPRVLTVGIDAITIQGCIDLATDATANNGYIIQVPPGRYNENLTLKGSVIIRGMGNQEDTISVTISGYHTLLGTAANTLNNRASIANVLLMSSNSVNPMFTIGGTTATQFKIQGCYLYSTAADASAVVVSIEANGSIYMDNSTIQMVGGAGTQINMSGGSIWMRTVRSSGGSKIINMSAAAYAEITYCTLSCAGTNEAITVYGNGAFGAFPLSGLINSGWTAFQNTASNGNGINLSASGASMLTYACSFDILSGATNYVVTGAAGSSFGQLSNSYGNIPGILSRNVKIKNTVTVLTYTGSLTSTA